MNRDGRRRTARELVGYPAVSVEALTALWPALAALDRSIVRALENDAHYRGYVERQEADIAAFRRDEALRLPGTSASSAWAASPTRCASGSAPRARRRWARREGCRGDAGGADGAARPRAQDRHPQDGHPQERGGGRAPVERMEPGEAFRRDVSRETRERLDIYEDLLRQRQRRTNLVSTASLPALWTRHFLDSAQLAPLLAAHAAGRPSMSAAARAFPAWCSRSWTANAGSPWSKPTASAAPSCARSRPPPARDLGDRGPARGPGGACAGDTGRHGRRPRLRAAGRPARSCFPCAGLPYMLYIPEGAGATGASWWRPACAGTSGQRSSPAARRRRRVS